jgi:hypothetical protein
MMVTCRTFGHDKLDIEDGGEGKKPEKKLTGGVLEGGMACIENWLDSYAAFLAKYKNFPSKSLFLNEEELILELRKAFPLILPGRQRTLQS